MLHLEELGGGQETTELSFEVQGIKEMPVVPTQNVRMLTSA